MTIAQTPEKEVEISRWKVKGGVCQAAGTTGTKHAVLKQRTVVQSVVTWGSFRVHTYFQGLLENIFSPQIFLEI